MSDIGLYRNKNEDAFCIVDLTDSCGAVVLAVADGMGGHRAGDVASTMSVGYIEGALTNGSIDTSSFLAIKDRLRDIVRETNDHVYDKSVKDPECEGMGTTLTAAVVSKACAAFVHVGDSCAYHIRKDKMKKITTDHTYVEELVKLGTLTREEALIHPQRNYITKVVGCFEVVEPDLYTIDLLRDDKILICSDGLNKMLDDDEILKIVSGSDDPEVICSELIGAANLRGGLDNISAVVFLN